MIAFLENIGLSEVIIILVAAGLIAAPIVGAVMLIRLYFRKP